MRTNELALVADTAQAREAKIKQAAEQGLLVNDAVLLFRKIVDRMPTSRWILEARDLVATDPVPEQAARRKAEVKEELDDLHNDLKVLARDWVVGWYACGGVYVTKDGAVEDFRHYVETLAPELAVLQLGGSGTPIPEAALEEIRGGIQSCAPIVVIELLKSAHLVVSEAMNYALLG